MFFAEPVGQGWLQFAELGLALLLSALIGLEREVRQKSAGLRTYTLVGLASALIILISKSDSLTSWRMAVSSSILRAWPRRLSRASASSAVASFSFAGTSCAASRPRPQYG